MEKLKKPLMIYVTIVALSALALGFSDQIFSNYYKDAYNATAEMRGFIEFPRELPGVLCIVLIAALSFIGDIRMAIVAHILSFIGIIALAFLTPDFNVMLIFLFINSVGMHMFFPLVDGIGMSLIDDSNVGKKMGQFKGVNTAFVFLASLTVFLGFRYDIFSFTTPIKLIFLLSGILCFIIILLFVALNKMVHTPVKKRELKIKFKKEYKYYYTLAIMNGVQKQIVIVYGPWVLIEILGQQTDSVALIGMFGALIGIFFIPLLGKWIDKYGVRKMLFLDALSFIAIYLIYGLLSGGFVSGTIPQTGFFIGLAIAILVLDKVSMQMAIIRTVYLKSIALDSADITPTISLGISMDHIVTIICAAASGIIWEQYGPQYIFYLAAAFSFINLYVAFKVRDNIADTESLSA
ncbi:MFS transporter [Candidatus Epulonipiscium viviparus]|uniref:MFS transporter n=1 Tax=Candidatus Epulonipiscium viviparus TaxID=420336 RepID=UPI00016BFD98|nr:MFS transporter [Candidatus Epulopiscium viviparus]